MLNQSQIEAISHKEGPAIVLAGPGSGKTTVVTHRIKNLIEKGVSPEKIMVVTFTKAAAVHMQKKFFCIMSGENRVKGNYPVTFGTFHSVYFRILKSSYGYRGQDIITSNIQKDIIREIILRKRIETGNIVEFIQSILGEISCVKGNMIQLRDYAPKCCKWEVFSDIFIEYERELKAEQKLDFDDIILRCYELFCEKPEVLRKWQEIFEYILIDEFQDINMIQYKVIKMLAKQRNIFVVGDDDQSIYGFRGACPAIMNKFLEDYKEAKKVVMNINYRSTPEIVKAAENLIGNNKQRFDKKIVSGNKKGRGADIRQFKNQCEELRYVTDKVRQYLKNGMRAEDIAILVRNNVQIPPIQAYFKNVQINTHSKKKGDNIYQGKVAKEVISYVRAAISYEKMPLRDNEHLIYILNKPQRYISRQVIGKGEIGLEELKKIYCNSSEIINNIVELQFHFDMIRKLKPGAAVTYIRYGAGYEKYLKQFALQNKVKFSVLSKQLDDISNAAHNFHTLEKWLEDVESQLSLGAKRDMVGEGIPIMTMHGSKGLEFKIVFILDVNQGIIPTTKAIREKDFEEERRVFYVAVTRAAEELFVFGIAKSLGCDVEMSMFANEMLE